MARAYALDSGVALSDRIDDPAGRRSRTGSSEGRISLSGRSLFRRRCLRYLDCGDDVLIDYLIDKILRLRSFDEDPSWEPVRPDPPPWDVPLDQTTASIHYEGDTSSV